MDDRELDAVMNAARSIPIQSRAAFLRAVGDRLENSGEAGTDVVTHAIAGARNDVIGPTFRLSVVLP